MLDFVPNFLIYLAVMALVTYLVRMLPLVLIKKKIENKYLSSFLYYIPYSVLTVMTVPGILYSTGHIISAVGATAIAVLLSYKRKSLITVAGASVLMALALEVLLYLLA